MDDFERQAEVRLVWDAAYKRDDLEARLGQMQGSGAEATGAEDSALERKVEALSRFVNHYSHMEGGPFEGPFGDKYVTAASKIKKGHEGKLQDRTWAQIEEVITFVIAEDGVVERDENGGSPTNVMIEATGWKKDRWYSIKNTTDRLGLLTFNGPEENFVTYDSISLELDNIRAIEELIVEGKLPEHLLEDMEELKARLIQESEQKKTESETKAAETEGPSDAELREIEISDEIEDLENDPEEPDPTARAIDPPVYKSKSERFASVTKRIIKEIQVNLDREVHRQYKPNTRLKNKTAGVFSEMIKFHINKAGEQVVFELGGREVFDLEDEARYLLGVAQANGPMHAAKADTAQKRRQIIMDIVNFGRNGDGLVEDDLDMLEDAAIERGELVMENPGDPKLTPDGLQVIKTIRAQARQRRSNAPIVVGSRSQSSL